MTNEPLPSSAETVETSVAPSDVKGQPSENLLEIALLKISPHFSCPLFLEVNRGAMTIQVMRDGVKDSIGGLLDKILYAKMVQLLSDDQEKVQIAYQQLINILGAESAKKVVEMFGFSLLNPETRDLGPFLKRIEFGLRAFLALGTLKSNELLELWSKKLEWNVYGDGCTVTNYSDLIPIFERNQVKPILYTNIAQMYLDCLDRLRSKLERNDENVRYNNSPRYGTLGELASRDESYTLRVSISDAISLARLFEEAGKKAASIAEVESDSVSSDERKT